MPKWRRRGSTPFRSSRRKRSKNRRGRIGDPAPPLRHCPRRFSVLQFRLLLCGAPSCKVPLELHQRPRVCRGLGDHLSRSLSSSWFGLSSTLTTAPDPAVYLIPFRTTLPLVITPMDTTEVCRSLRRLNGSPSAGLLLPSVVDLFDLHFPCEPCSRRLRVGRQVLQPDHRRPRRHRGKERRGSNHVDGGRPREKLRQGKEGERSGTRKTTGDRRVTPTPLFPRERQPAAADA
jgi:hypothetical protein